MGYCYLWIRWRVLRKLHIFLCIYISSSVQSCVRIICLVMYTHSPPSWGFDHGGGVEEGGRLKLIIEYVTSVSH